MSTKTKISEMSILSELTSDIIVPASQKSGQTYISGTISLEALRNYLKPELENHINDENQHISDEERNAWNRAVITLEAFLKDADTSENAVDTLVEIQRLMDDDGFDATELLNRIAALESIDYATKADIPEMPNLDGYAKLEDLDNISAPDLSNYALKSDIPSTVGFASINSSNNLVKDSSTVTQLTIGSGLQSPNNNCLTVGRYNSSTSNWNAMLWVGSGTSTSARKNQMIVQENQIHYRGELKEASGWIGDFGEYFEWNDGNPNNEDRIGYMVQLNEDKIELAESIEKCIGVISDTCIITGGGCSFEWHNMYLKDDFGRELKDENGNSIINPEYNPNVKYISRDKRQEWGKVGILGQVHTRQDGTLKVGGFAGCENGIATDSDHGYRVLRIINDNVAVLLVK